MLHEAGMARSAFPGMCSFKSKIEGVSSLIGGAFQAEGRSSEEAVIWLVAESHNGARVEAYLVCGGCGRLLEEGISVPESFQCKLTRSSADPLFSESAARKDGEGVPDPMANAAQYAVNQTVSRPLIFSAFERASNYNCEKTFQYVEL